MVGDAISHAVLPGIVIAFLVSGGSRDPLTMLLVPLIAVSGPTVSSPLQGALEYASTLAWAALLTIAYLPPVSDLFVAADGPATATTKHVDA